MAHEIRVVFHNGEPIQQIGLVRFRPNEQMSGEVILRPDGDITCNHLWVRLQWHTEGRGDRDREKVAELDLFQGHLKGGMEHSFPFAL